MQQHLNQLKLELSNISYNWKSLYTENLRIHYILLTQYCSREHSCRLNVKNLEQVIILLKIQEDLLLKLN